MFFLLRGQQLTSSTHNQNELEEVKNNFIQQTAKAKLYDLEVDELENMIHQFTNKNVELDKKIDEENEFNTLKSNEISFVESN